MADVCALCIVDDCLQELIGSKGKRGECTFCERSNRKVLAIPDVAEHIHSCLLDDYDCAENVLCWAEGEWMGDTYETYELLEKLEIGCEDPVLEALVEQIDDGQAWCDSDVNGTPSEILCDGWQQFEEVIKHEARFLWWNRKRHLASNPSSPSPLQTLKLVANLIQRHSLFTVVPAGAHLFRLREVADGAPGPSRACDFGPPPVRLALQSNRMNPPGIRAFYASFDEETCTAEVPGRQGYRRFLATIVPNTDVKLVDLTRFPPPPPRLSLKGRENRPELQFLQAFADVCARPVARDDRVHVDYVPTQVVCEFLMHSFAEQGVKGIKFSSTRTRGDNIVLYDGPGCMIEDESVGGWATQRGYLALKGFVELSNTVLEPSPLELESSEAYEEAER